MTDGRDRREVQLLDGLPLARVLAKGESAKLTVTDWTSDKDPGGPVGQELMFNFIEIQPYLED